MIETAIDVSAVRLETERLLLRPWQETDIGDLFDYARDPDVGPAAGWEPHRSLMESGIILRRFIQGKRTLAIEEKASGRVVGSIGLEELPVHLGPEYADLRGCEIGYVLAKPRWGKGYMTEAVRKVIQYCFEDLGLDLLVCGHFVWNGRSANVIRKCGFRYLKLVENETHAGIIEPTKLYILRAEDYL